MTTTEHAPGADHSELQRRTIGVLFGSSIPARAAMSLAFTVAALAIEEMLGSERLAGLSTVAITVGTAIASGWLSSLMLRSGRNPGLRTGYALATIGALIGGLGIELSNIAIFLGGLALFGVGQGATNLSRYAAADLATEETRATAISSVVFASAFGAVLGPMAAGFLGNRALDLGANEYTGPFVGAALCFAFAGAIIWFFLRPDPLVVAGGLQPKREAGDTRKQSGITMKAAASLVWSRPLPRLAALSLIVSQAVMVMVMAMTPLHMKAHDHSTGWIGLVIAAHTAGMFLFAPFAGSVSDRIGRVPTILAGSAILTAATVITALAGEAPRALMFPGLFLLGLGWSFGMVAGSALLTESVTGNERVAVQGAADIATSLASGVGALASGFVLNMAGFHILSMIGTAFAGLLVVLSFVRFRLDGGGPAAGLASA